MWVLTAGQYAASITAILALFGVIVKWGIVKPIKAYIDQATYPISPNANGGKSLPDAIFTLKRIETKIDSLEQRIVKLERKKPLKN